MTVITNGGWALILSFNPPACEVVFSWTISETRHPLLMINNAPFKRILFLKHLGLILDPKLDVNELINAVLF